MRINTKTLWVYVVVIISLMLIPQLVVAILPSSTSYNRYNTYELDGYRNGGYYIERHNPTINGTMNITYNGNNFTIETENIANMILDFDLMYEKRSFLFGWASITWREIVSMLDNTIYITINNTDDIDQLTFADQPNVRVKVTTDGIVTHDWVRLNDVEFHNDTLSSGSHVVIIEFNRYLSTLDLLIDLLVLIVFIFVVFIIIKGLRDALYGDKGEYYEKFGKVNQ